MIKEKYISTADLARIFGVTRQAIQIEDSSDIPMIRKAQFFEYEKRIPEAIEQYKITLNKFPGSEYAKK